MLNDQQILEEIHTLPPDKRAEVIDFIQFLKSRSSQSLRDPVAIRRQPPAELQASVIIKGDLFEPFDEADWDAAT